MVNFYMMMGLPGSGKSTKAKQIAEKEDAIIISSDAIRKELYGNEEIQGDNNKVFNIMLKRTIEYLSAGKNVVYDATNLKRKNRNHVLEAVSRCCFHKYIIIMATPFEECLKRNRERERKAPESVIWRMRKSFQFPNNESGFNPHANIKIVYDKDKSLYENYNLIDKINELKNFDQENPHHKLSLGEHLIVTYSYFIDESYSEFLSKDMGFITAERILGMAALLHDIGKEYTKDKRDSKGNVCDIAHYYNHENVSSYESMMYLHNINIYDKEESVKEIVTLVQNHMMPYSVESIRKNDPRMVERTINKYKRQVGSYTWDMIEKFHKADKFAH